MLLVCHLLVKEAYLSLSQLAAVAPELAPGAPEPPSTFAELYMLLTEGMTSLCSQEHYSDRNGTKGLVE